jgi:hypothetical protein
MPGALCAGSLKRTVGPYEELSDILPFRGR